ncbi:MAG: sodium-dependent transporter, partial [Clostridia bacterium]|nr:sodium-dependent transporter [Clostridia bacterium]
MTETKRSSFTGKIGFVLAAAGSAVGLGNIWRFPYLAAKYGGGIFLLVYLLLAVTFGFSLMVAEIAIGRKSKLSAIGAFKALDKRFSFVGWMAALVPVVILPYYSVIVGWVIKYFWGFLVGSVAEMSSEGFFG